jgi:hypothetical protein
VTDPAQARRALITARQIREEAEPRWRAAIVAAVEAGIPVAEVADIAGCTRQRVYQIRDAARSNRLDNRPW